MAYIESLEKLLIVGRHREVGRNLRSLNLTQIPRQFRLNLSQVAYRAGFPEISLKIIHKIIHPDKKRPDEAVSPFELAEYAASLIKVGASTESFRFLDAIDSKVVSKVNLYRAYAHITEWNYVSALGPLSKYVLQTDPADYSSIVAKVNLAACYVQTEAFTEAKELLSHLEITTARDQHKLLLANVHELMAQVMISSRQFKDAKKYLEKAANSLAASGSLDLLFVKKWNALLAYHLKDRSAKTLKAMYAVRAEAASKNHYETLREMDFYLSQMTKDKNLFLKVYFGTPYSSYKASLLRRIEFPLNIPQDFIVGRKDFCLNVAEAIIENQKMPSPQTSAASAPPVLKKAKVLYKLLNTLASDLYRPFRLGSLFSKVYPDEHYDPFASQERIHQIIKRLRNEFRIHNLDLSILCSQHSFQLIVNQETGLKLSSQPTVSHHYEAYLSQMIETFGPSLFTSSKAAKVLGLSKRLINNIILWDNGRSLNKIGSGRSSKYQIIAARNPISA